MKIAPFLIAALLGLSSGYAEEAFYEIGCPESAQLVQESLLPQDCNEKPHSKEKDEVNFEGVDPEMIALEELVLEKINQYRQSRGLPALALNRVMTTLAREHTDNMAEGIVPFSHDGFLQRARTIWRETCQTRMAENVAWVDGGSDPAEIAVQGWINSPGHHRNITGNYDTTGIGAARDANGRIYFTQLFAGGSYCY